MNKIIENKVNKQTMQKLLGLELIHRKCLTTQIQSTQTNTSDYTITHNPDAPFALEYIKWHTIGDTKKKRKKMLMSELSAWKLIVPTIY